MHASRAMIGALLGFCTTLIAQDWPRFRGPNGTGMASAKLPEQFTSENILWRAELPGSGHSSPVTWGDRVFLTCTTANSGPAEQARRSVVCVSGKDGSLLWQKEFATGSYRMH